MKKNVVSICVGAYQHSRYIRECLDSLLAQQTNFPYEIILGEDQSNDGTREICMEYAKRHPDLIKLFLRDRKDVIYIDGKPSGRFNFMQNLKECKGEYLALCDGDDYWADPHKLQKQKDFLDAHPDFAISFHAVLNDNGKEKERSDLNRMESEMVYTINDLSEKNLIHTPSVMYRNVLEGNLPAWFPESPLGDYSLHMLHAKHGKIHYSPELMAVYRRHPGGTFSPLKEREIILRSLRTILLLQTESFPPDVTQRLDEQKRKYINQVLDLNFNNWNYQQFKTDIHLVLSDDILVKYWLTERLPERLENLKSSRTFKISESLQKAFRFLKPLRPK